MSSSKHQDAFPGLGLASFGQRILSDAGKGAQLELELLAVRFARPS